MENQEFENLKKKLEDITKSLESIKPHAGVEKILNVKSVIEKKNLKLKETDGRIQTVLGFNITKGTAPNSGPEAAIGDPRNEEDYYPDDDELVAINRDSLVHYPKEKYRVFTLQSADMVLDRGYEAFTEKALNTMAKMAVKNAIPFLMDGEYDHEWALKNVRGRVFDAYVQDEKLCYKVYMPVIEKTKDILEAIYTGVYNKLSVGFSIDPEMYVCNSCGKSMFYESCMHYPGGTDSKGMTVTVSIEDVSDNYEISGVAVPMEPDAHIRQNSYKLQNGVDEYYSDPAGGSKVLNSSIFKKGGLIGDIMQLNTTKTVDELRKLTKNILDDKIIDGTLTIEDNISMSVDTQESTKDREAIVSAEAAPAEVSAPDTVNAPGESAVTPAVAVSEVGKAEEVTTATTKETSLTKRIKKAVKTAKKALKASKAQRKTIEGITEAIDKLQQTIQDAIGTNVPTKAIVKEVETAAVPQGKVTKSNSWISQYWDATDLIGGQE